MLTKLPWKNNFYILFLSLLFAYFMQYSINLNESSLAYTNSFLSFCLFGAFAYAIRQMTKSKTWDEISKLTNAGFAFSCLFAAAIVMGVQLDQTGNVNFHQYKLYLSILILGIGLAPFVAGIIYWLSRRQICNTSNQGDRRYFVSLWLLFILAYIPTLLASLPGFFTYDAETEVYMAMTGKYSSHHPMAHVLLIGFILKLFYKLFQSYNAGIIAYTILQIIITSGCFSYMLYTLKKLGVHKWICNLSFVFLAFFPTVSMFVCCSTKDVYFSVGLVLLTTLLIEFCYNQNVFMGSTRHKILFVIASLLLLLFRNNGIYVYVIFSLLFLCFFRIWFKKLFPVLAAAFILYFSFNITVNNIYNVQPGSVAEMLCVPMQQLARVHAEDKATYSDDDLELLYTLIPKSVLENYNPKLADDIKFNFLLDNFKANFPAYFKLWIQTGFKQPDIYINSFLANTYGYWYPDTVIDGYEGKQIVDKVYGDSSYFAFVTEMPGVRNSLFPVLESFYEKISFEIYQQKIPVVSMLFSIGFWQWIFLFVIFYLLNTKGKIYIIALIPMLLVYLTMLLGPIALVRYVIYFFFSVPLLFSLLFDTNVFLKTKMDE